MIIYGSTERAIHSSALPNQTCASCQTKGSMMAQINQRYAHIFWIPFFPAGKPVYSMCGNCKQVLKKKEMPDNLKKDVMDVKAGAKTPLYSFSGLGIITLLAAFLFYQGSQTKKEEANYLSAPQVDDVYVMKTREDGKTAYYFLKVEEVNSDTVFYTPSNYEMTGGQPTSREYKKQLVEKSDFYSPELYYWLSSELQAMHQADSLVQVFREN